jgi:hypothetical protein
MSKRSRDEKETEPNDCGSPSPSKKIKTEDKEVKETSNELFNQAAMYMYHPWEEKGGKDDGWKPTKQKQFAFWAFIEGRNTVIRLWENFLCFYKNELLMDLKTEDDVHRLRKDFLDALDEMEHEYTTKNQDCPRCEKDVRECRCISYDLEEKINEPLPEPDSIAIVEDYNPSWLMKTNANDPDLIEKLVAIWKRDNCFPTLVARIG